MLAKMFQGVLQITKPSSLLRKEEKIQMKIIKPSVELMTDFDGENVLKFIELCGRVCYKSEKNITDTSAENFVRNLIKRGHESVLEHFSVTFRIICDRGVMAELTRHRLASFSIESTRYNSYDELKFIKPNTTDENYFRVWENQMIQAEEKYLQLRQCETKPELARNILPTSLKTEIIMTANLREWRHILKLRTDKKAHPQMRQVAQMILKILQDKLPVVFGEIGNAE